MAQKKKLKQQSGKSKKEHVSSKKLWPNLPPWLLGFIPKNPAVMQNMSFGGVSKSWRATSSRCNFSGSSPPQLLLSESYGRSNGHPGKLIESLNLTFPYPWFGYPWYNKKYGIWQDWKYIVGYSQEMLVTRWADFSEMALTDPSKRSWYSLPPWNANVPPKLVVLSSTIREFFENGKNAVILALTGTNCPAFAFYSFSIDRKDNDKWVEQDLTLTEPNSGPDHSNYMQFTNAIGMKGKFYVLSLQGTLAVVEYADSRAKVVALCRDRAVPTIPSRHFREYLVDFDGNTVLLVLLISRRSRVGSVDDVEVFRLKEDGKLSWVKMETLRDRTLVAGTDCCISVLAIELASKRNCVYFTQDGDDCWQIYDFKTGRIS